MLNLQVLGANTLGSFAALSPLDLLLVRHVGILELLVLGLLDLLP